MGLAFLFLFIIGLGIYLLPTIIAFSRGHASKLAITLVNIFLGWSILAWFIALVWSLADSGRNNQVIINNMNNLGRREGAFTCHEPTISEANIELIANKAAERIKRTKGMELGHEAHSHSSQIELLEETKAQIIKCPSCNQGLGEEDKFCSSCGAKV